jgi:hypothetical protein
LSGDPRKAPSHWLEEDILRKIAGLIGLVVILAGCENMYDDDGIPRIGTQADATAYNATVSSESEKLVCTREQVIGTNIRQFVCLTVAQREFIRIQAQEDARNLSETLNRTGLGAGAN